MHLWASWRESYNTSLFLQLREGERERDGRGEERYLYTMYLLISAGSPFCLAASSFFFHAYEKKLKNRSSPFPSSPPPRHLQKSFKLVAAISKGSDSVDVERILSLTNGRCSLFFSRHLGPFVCLAAVVGQSLLLQQGLLVGGSRWKFTACSPGIEGAIVSLSNWRRMV